MDQARQGEAEAREENIEAKEIIRKPIFTIMEEYANLKLSQQQAPVLPGMRWVKASERLPKNAKLHNLRKLNPEGNYRPLSGNYNSVGYFNTPLGRYETGEIEWLDDESPSIPFPTEQEIEAAAEELCGWKSDSSDTWNQVREEQKKAFKAAISWYQRLGK